MTLGKEEAAKLYIRCTEDFMARQAEEVAKYWLDEVNFELHEETKRDFVKMLTGLVFAEWLFEPTVFKICKEHGRHIESGCNPLTRVMLLLGITERDFSNRINYLAVYPSGRVKIRLNGYSEAKWI